MNRLGRWLSALTLLGVLGCKERSEITIFHAASLARSFSELSESLARSSPKYRVRLEASGSQVAARKISELNLRADLVAVADRAVIDEMLVPRWAKWNLVFASTELVIAHREHSRFTEEITTENWMEVLTRSGVTLGCVNPDLAPIGYRTLMAWQLAETSSLAAAPARASLAERLRAGCAPEHVMQDESGLLALLSSKSVDYVFMYRSTAEEHHLKITSLPVEVNLGHVDQAARYERARVAVHLGAGEERTEIRGAPILFGLTMPTSAPNPEGGRVFLEHLYSGAGEKILRRSGFTVLAPPLLQEADPAPIWLKALVERGR